MDIILVPLLITTKMVIGFAMTVVITDVLLSWLVALNILNMENRVISTIVDAFSRISNFMLNPIRARMPSDLGTFDISPVILLVLLTFFEHVITRILIKIV